MPSVAGEGEKGSEERTSEDKKTRYICGQRPIVLQLNAGSHIALGYLQEEMIATYQWYQIGA